MVADQARRLDGVFGGISTPVLAANWRDSGKTLHVHVAAGVGRSRAKAEILAALANAGIARVRIHFHTSRDLTAPRSLERLIANLGDGEIAHDPTEAITRAKALVAASHSVRASLTDAIGGIFFAPRTRTLFVSLASRFAGVDKFKIAELATIEVKIIAALKNAFAGRTAEIPAVRVGIGLPNAALVPVDHGSVVGWSTRTLRAISRYWKPVAIATMFGFGANAAAAAEPAVSETNLKVTAAATDSNGSNNGWFFGGALTAPVGERWGFEAEAAVSGDANDTVYGAAGHLFTRDPSSHLLGIFAAYASEDTFGLDLTTIGAEAEIYQNQLSILAKAGYAFSNAAVLEGGFADIDLRWYITDDFAVTGGASFRETADNVGRASAEWRPGFSALPGLAFRIDGAWGDNDYEAYSGGLTYYFGSDASLKDRHRKQDPDSALLSLFQAVQTEQQKLCAQYGCN